MFELESFSGFNDACEAAVVAGDEDLTWLNRQWGTTVGTADFFCYGYHAQATLETRKELAFNGFLFMRVQRVDWDG